MSTIPILNASPEVVNQYLAQLSDEELQQLGLLPGPKGAPADFGGAVFPNPQGVRVYDDTESGNEPTKLPAGVGFHRENFSGPMPTDVTNPERAQILPTATKSAPAFDPNAGYEKAAAPAFDPEGEYSAAEQKQEDKKPPGWLDREIPLTSHWKATESGLQSIGRGFRQIYRGTVDMFAPPQDATESAIAGQQHGEALLPVYRFLKSIGTTLADSTEVLDAVRAINNSPDPAGTYAKALQSMSGEGAAQALTALATEGVIRGGPPTVKAVAKVATPENIGTAAGGAIGGKLGAMVGEPIEGAAAGAYVGRKLVQKFRKSPVAPEPQLTPMQQWWKERGGTLAEERPQGPIRAESPKPSEPGPARAPEPVEAEPVAVEPEAQAPAEVLSKPGTPAELEARLNEALGGKPLERGVPLRQQGTAKPQPTPPLPEGFTPVESSALKGYKYNPATKEFEAVTKNGQHYIHGEVSPDQAAAFEAAESKGAAWTKEIRNNNPLVAKVIDGERVPVRTAGLEKPSGETIRKSKAGMEPQADLTETLKKSVESVKSAKGGLITSAEPAELMKRWGVDEESLVSGREQTRGMTAEQVEAQIKKLTEAYKKGQAIEPIMETRDAANNLIDVDGRMRVIAAHRAGIKRIPVIVRRLKAVAGD